MANTITVTCPKCSYEMRASAKHIGRKGKCSNCGNLVTIRPDDAQESAATLYGADSDEGVQTASTGANPLLAGLIGLGAAVLLYAGFYALAQSDNYLGVFMTKRSKIQHMITLVTCWGLALIVLKYLAVKRELRSTERELELIPLEIGMQITSANADKFLAHLRQLPPEEQDSVLARRIRGALEHLKHRNNVSEVQSYLATQADIEASAVDSGYTLMRVFIWVCPILGFIGTVLGISDAVTELAKSLPQTSAAVSPAPAAKPAAGDALGDKLMNGMREVTNGLATAFDTTMLGLVCVVMLMFPTEALKKIEYDMLDRVQAFSNESLLRRMAEGQGGGPGSEMPEIVQRTLDAAFKEHQRWLTQWQAQVAQLGNLIGADFESHFGACQDKLTVAEGKRVEALDTAARRVEDLFGRLQDVTATWEKSGGLEFKSSLSAAAQLQQSLQGNTSALTSVLVHQSQLMEKYSRSDLQAVLQSLADAVARLGSDRGRMVSPPVPLLPDKTQPSDGRFPTPAFEPDFAPLEPVPTVQSPTAHAELGRPAVRKPGLFGRILGRGGN
jgi:biopolymer transport protein ExbB/TolQ